MPNIDHFSNFLDSGDPRVQTLWDRGTTPRRQTKVLFDVCQPLKLESHWGGTRYGAQICTPAAKALGAASSWTRRVRYWPSIKAWTLEPIQERWRWTEEVPDSVTLDDIVYRSGSSVGELELLTIQTTQMRMNAIPFGTGMTHSGGAGFENNLVRKAIVSGASWDESLSMPALPNPITAGVSAGTGLTALPASVVPMDCVCHTQQTQREDLGMFLRWIVPGHQNLFPDYILVAYFGQYGLGIAGDGTAYLFEWCRATVAGPYRWRLRKQWQYCPPQAVTGVNHTMTIFPVRGQNQEPMIVFSSRQVASGTVTWGENHVPVQETVYVANQVNREDDYPEATYGQFITKRSYFRLDVRRDLRVAWSLARLMFWNRGQIIDAAWEVAPYTAGGKINRQVYYHAPVKLSGGGVMGNIELLYYNARDPLHPLLDMDAPSPADAAPYALIAFLGAGSETVPGTAGARKAQSYTPVLWGYRLWRDAVIIPAEDVTPDTITLGVRHVSVQDPGPSPKNATAQIETADMTGEHTRLVNRGYLPTKIVIEYIPGPGEEQEGILQKVPIFNGVAMRPRHAKLTPDNDAHEGGSDRQAGGMLGGAVIECPTPQRIEAALAGMATLANEVNTGMVTYQQFARYEGGTHPITGLPDPAVDAPYKVTDAIRFMLRTRFPEVNIAIEDIDLRLFGNFGQSMGDLEYEPHTDIIDRCVAMARNYLGSYLIYDLHAGPVDPDGAPGGAWVLRRIKPATATAVAHIVSHAVRGAGTMMPKCPLDGVGYVPLIEPLTEYTSPPEANHFWVIAAPPQSGERYQKVDFHAYNPQSYDVPGMSVVPDPESPHFIGHEKLAIIPAPELWIGGDLVSTRNACMVVARRLLQFAGCARKIVVGRGPLHLFWDEEASHWRTLRYGDPVTWNGEAGWIVRSCSPAYNHDMNQMATYEIERLLGHMESGVEVEP